MRIIITYLIRVFDTTWESKFWVLKFLFLGQFSIFHADLKAIKAFESVKKSFIFISCTVFAKTRVKVDAVVSVKWCGCIYKYISSRFIYSKIARVVSLSLSN